jgi:uncharacterized membrane protein
LSAPDADGARGPSPWLFVPVFVLYVVLGLLAKSAVLNWIVGPLFPLLVLYVIPHLAGRARRRLVGP